MYVYHLFAWFPQNPEDDIKWPVPSIKDDCHLLCGYRESISGPLEEQPS